MSNQERHAQLVRENHDLKAKVKKAESRYRNAQNKLNIIDRQNGSNFSKASQEAIMLGYDGKSKKRIFRNFIKYLGLTSIIGWITIGILIASNVISVVV